MFLYMKSAHLIITFTIGNPSFFQCMSIIPFTGFKSANISLPNIIFPVFFIVIFLHHLLLRAKYFFLTFRQLFVFSFTTEETFQYLFAHIFFFNGITLHYLPLKVFFSLYRLISLPFFLVDYFYTSFIS